MSQQTLDLIQSIVIGLLVLRNIQLKNVITKNTYLILRQSQIGVNTSRVLTNITKALKKASLEIKEEEE